jgi:hypothetical protein
MINIAIEYPVLFFKRTATGQAPTSWGELTRRQFIAISRTVNGAEPDFRFLSQLTGIRKNLIKKLSSYELFQLSEAIDFIDQAGNSHSAFIITKIPGTDYVSPKPKLGGMTFGQFIFTESYYNDWQVTKAEADLNNFIASLFLTQGEKFDSETIAENAVKIKLVDLDIRQAIAFNYGLIMVWLQKCYPLIFQEKAEASPDLPSPDKQPKQSQWLKIFESLVGDDLINRDRYAELSVHAVLRYLTNKYKENARQ